MITLDQVLLLEKKVESAVARIQQLQAENDALRSRCAELTNALSSKSEQLSSFETNQSQIESGILSALDRLSQIENSVLHYASQASTPQQTFQQEVQIKKTEVQDPAPIQQTTPIQESAAEIPVAAQAVPQQAAPVVEETQNIQPSFTNNVSFDNMQNVPAEESEIEENPEETEEVQDNLGFDIF